MKAPLPPGDRSSGKKPPGVTRTALQEAVDRALELVNLTPVTVIVAPDGWGKSRMLSALQGSLEAGKRRCILATLDPRQAPLIGRGGVRTRIWSNLAIPIVASQGPAPWEGSRETCYLEAALAAGLEEAEAAGHVILLDDLDTVDTALGARFLQCATRTLSRARLVAAMAQCPPLAPSIRKSISIVALDTPLGPSSGSPPVSQEAQGDGGRGGPDASEASRLAALSPAASRTLRLLALSPEPLERRFLRRLGAHQDGIDALIGLGLVREIERSGSSTCVVTTRRSVAQAVESSLRETEARSLHRALATALIATISRGRRSGPDPVRILTACDHMMAARDWASAAALLCARRSLILDGTERIRLAYLTRLTQFPPELMDSFPILELDRVCLLLAQDGPHDIVRSSLARLASSTDPRVAGPALGEELILAARAALLHRSVARCERALRSSSRCADAAEGARIRSAVGAAFACAGQYQRAHKLIQEALTLFRQARASIGIARETGALAAVLALTGHAARAKTAMHEAIAMARRLHRRDLAGHLLAMESELAQKGGALKEADRINARARAELAGALEFTAHARALTAAGEIALARGDYARARKHLGAARGRLAPACHGCGLLATDTALGQLAAETGDLASARQALATAQDTAIRLGDARRLAQIQILQAHVLRLSGNPQGAKALLGGLLVETRRERLAGQEGEVLHQAATVALEEGDVQQAARQAQAASEAFRVAGSLEGQARAQGLLARLSLEIGRLDEATRRAQRGLEKARELGDPRGLTRALTLAAQVSLERKEPGEAQAYLGEAMKLRKRVGDHRGVASTCRLLAQIALESGRLGEARRWVVRGLASAPPSGYPVERGWLELVAAMVALRSGMHAQAYHRARDLRPTSPSDPELAIVATRLMEVAASRGSGAGPESVARDHARACTSLLSALSPIRAARISSMMDRWGLEPAAGRPRS